jgi:hypothetical protein
MSVIETHLVQGSVHLKAPFTKEPKELILHPFQASMVVLFNDADEISVAEMMERLNLSEEDVVRTVSSLAHAKATILKRKKMDGGEDGGGEREKGKEKPGGRKKPSKTDVYVINWGFTDKFRRCARLTAPARTNSWCPHSYVPSWHLSGFLGTLAVIFLPTNAK